MDSWQRIRDREREQDDVARRYLKVTDRRSATAAGKRRDKREKGGECGVRRQRDRCRKLPPQSVGELLHRRPAPCGRRKREKPVEPVNLPGVKARNPPSKRHR